MSHEPVRIIHLREFKAITRAIITYDDLDLLINHMVERICRSFQVKACSIFLFDDRENELFRVGSYGVSKEYQSKGPLPIDEKASAFFKGAPVFIKDMQNDPRVKYPEFAAREGFASMLSVPIKHGGLNFGILRIYHHSPWDLHEDDLDSFSLLGESLGLVIQTRGLKNFFDKLKVAMESLPLRMLKGL